MSLPRPPSMKSLPSPPRSPSSPSPPVIVSLPAPPSRVSWISPARPLPAVMTSSPPLALRTRFSRGADVQEERGRVDAVEADAGAVGGDGERLGDVAADDLDGVVAGAALVEGAAVAGVPDHAVVARLAEDLVVARAAGQDVVAGAAEQSRCRPCRAGCRCPAWPKSWSAPEPPVRVSLPAPPNRWAFGRAPLASSRVMVSLPAWPNTLISVVLATVGVPPRTATAPPLTRMLPGGVAADGDGVVPASPKTVRMPRPAAKRR